MLGASGKSVTEEQFVQRVRFGLHWRGLLAQAIHLPTYIALPYCQEVSTFVLPSQSPLCLG
jgi:hypothetical protein